MTFPCVSPYGIFYEQPFKVYVTLLQNGTIQSDYSAAT